MGLSLNGVAGGGEVLGQDGESEVQPIDSDTTLLLGGLFPINMSPQFNMGRKAASVEGQGRSKRVSGKVR